MNAFLFPISIFSGQASLILIVSKPIKVVVVVVVLLGVQKNSKSKDFGYKNFKLNDMALIKFESKSKFWNLPLKFGQH